MDQFDLLLIRDEGFQGETDNYEGGAKQMLVEFAGRNSLWIKNTRIAYARKEPSEETSRERSTDSEPSRIPTIVRKHLSS